MGNNFITMSLYYGRNKMSAENLAESESKSNTLNGVFFVSLLAFTATYISDLEIMQSLSISPLIIGIILGLIYANTLHHNFPTEWSLGVSFSTKTILRIAIIFYGFRLSYSNIVELGSDGLLISFLMVITTFTLGYFVGTKILKLDPEITILTSAGSAICGAAAILATESILKSESYKSTVAVSTVIVFGTISMFLYPMLYNLGVLDVSVTEMGVFIGGSLHEVAHVVAASNATDETIISNNAVVTKMLRVMFLAPFLMIIGFIIVRNFSKKSKNVSSSSNSKPRIFIPWFAFLFMVVVVVNSIYTFPPPVLNSINTIDTFALTMTMSALGMQSNLNSIKRMGLKPFYLAFILFIWLSIGGYFITKATMDPYFITKTILSLVQGIITIPACQ